ncbi:DUF4158 domain-containing protein [Microtetraspora malaysiensis]|uniref:DUF4158 domain-containing protein n=1 Tax=Microtetraspora malaysiensis TaxID=161358 RepID=UPI003D91C446
MPVEFLSDEQVGAYGAFASAPSRADLERYFFLDDADRALVEAKRRPHNRLGYALQLTVVRYLGVFPDDVTEVPDAVVEYLAAQLGITDVGLVKEYGAREKTRFEHMWELRAELGYRDLAAVEAELRSWVDARAWTTGDGPKALLDASVGWLRERRVLLPGVSTLARLQVSAQEAGERPPLLQAVPRGDRRGDQPARTRRPHPLQLVFGEHPGRH